MKRESSKENIFACYHATSVARMSDEGGLDLTDCCSRYELDSDTLATLKEQKLTSEAALNTFSPQDCAALKLPMGQHNLLRNAVRAMQPTSPKSGGLGV